MNNSQISTRLIRIADLLELLNADADQIRAHRDAADRVSRHPEEMGVLIDEDRFKGLPHLDGTVRQTILMLSKSGSASLEKDLTAKLPKGLPALLDLQTLSLDSVITLWKQHDIRDLDTLEKACDSGALLSIRGFDEEQVKHIMAEIEDCRRSGFKVLLDNALERCEVWMRLLRSCPSVSRIEQTGQIRRRDTLIAQLDLILIADKEPLKKFVREQVGEVTDADDKLIAQDTSGLPLHLHLSHEQRFSLDQLRLTGGAKFLQGFPADLDHAPGSGSVRLNEAEICLQFGRQWIAPELRDHYSEWDDRLELLQTEHIKGIFHAHSSWSDGLNTLEEMVQRSIDLGYEYFGISDHSQAAYYANGLQPERVKAQWREIDALQEKYPQIKIFKGIEAEILVDGALDYEPDLLAGFDFVIASIHSHFHLDPGRQTERLIRALQSPFTTMLGHPTGRMLQAREGYGPDIEAVLQAAAEYDKVIELNTTPKRLDLDWTWFPRVRELNIRLSINPDAHKVSGLETIPLGVMMCRKGGITPASVLNTLSVDEVEAYLLSRRNL